MYFVWMLYLGCLSWFCCVIFLVVILDLIVVLFLFEFSWNFDFVLCDNVYFCVMKFGYYLFDFESDGD